MLSLTEKIRSRSYRRNLPTLVSLLSPKKDDVILDVGAGTGTIASSIAKYSDEVFALEPNEKRVEHIKANHPEVKAFSSVANSIPFPPNYFDKLYVVSAFHHFPDQEDALEEFRRVIKKGGLLLVNEISDRSLGPRLEKWIHGTKLNFVTSGALEEMARKHEFEKMEIKENKGGYFFLARNAKSGEAGSAWLGDSVKEERSARF
jgi:ubiquinone/menaquinone biosynthesis C-methylase UbiE